MTGSFFTVSRVSGDERDVEVKLGRRGKDEMPRQWGKKGRVNKQKQQKQQVKRKTTFVDHEVAQTQNSFPNHVMF